MSERTRYHVTPRPDGQWQGIREGADRASVLGNTQTEVVEQMVKIAKNQEPSQLFIHRENGQVRDERTYGGDPYPPPG